MQPDPSPDIAPSFAGVGTQLPGATPLQGGVPPLGADGQCVGAIGVSGDTPQIDENIAKAGAAAL